MYYEHFTILQPRTEEMLSLTVQYNCIMCPPIGFCFLIYPCSENTLTSSLKIYVNRTSIPNDYAFLDAYVPTVNSSILFDMNPVYISLLQPFAQVLIITFLK